jgi:hypothetical protein
MPLPNVMNLFRGTPGNSPAAVDPNAPPANTPATEVKTKTPPVGAEGGTLDTPGAKQKQASPLDGYADLWEPPKSKEVPAQGNQPAAVVPGNKEPQVPAFLTRAKSLNFSRNIPQDLMAKAVGGDANALAAVIDHVGRQSAAAAFHYAESHFSSASGKLKEDITGSLPEQFKQFSLNNTPVRHPVLNKPGVKPMVEAIRAQLATKFPEATTEELQKNAEDYFIAFQKELGAHDETVANAASAETDKLKQQQSAQANGAFDWDEYYGMKPAAGNQ